MLIYDQGILIGITAQIRVHDHSTDWEGSDQHIPGRHIPGSGLIAGDDNPRKEHSERWEYQSHGSCHHAVMEGVIQSRLG